MATVPWARPTRTPLADGPLPVGSSTVTFAVARPLSRLRAVRAAHLGSGATVRLCALGLLGATIAQVAWESPDIPVGARLSELSALPLVWGAVDRRREALVLFAAYQAWALRHMPHWLAALPTGREWGLPAMAWLSLVLLSAIPWASLVPPKSETRGSCAIRCWVALVSVSIPPLGWICPVGPLALSAGLFPGTGWCGLGSGCLYAGVLAVSARRAPAKALMVVAMSSVWAVCWPASAASPPPGWAALSTRLGSLDGSFDGWYRRHVRLVTAVESQLDRRATLVLLPESVAGPWGPAADVWWRAASAKARARGAIVLVGAEVASGGVRLNALQAVGAIEGTVAAARLVAPLYWWKPWERGGVRPAPGGTARTLDYEGRRIGFSFCVEDLSPVAVLGLFVGPRRADVLASVANHGWMPPGESARVQGEAVAVWSRLFGVPLLRADNDPEASTR